MDIHVPISAGELVDKITILEIKASRIIDKEKRGHVVRELDALLVVRDAAIPPSAEIDTLTTALRKINEQLWDIEDEIRVCEAAQDFGARFVQLARDVYFTNDERAKLKKELNLLTGSRFVEQKSYQDYQKSA